MRILALLLFLSVFASAREITLEYIKSKPSSLQRDFLISLYLDQNISSKEADEAFSLIYRSKFSNFKKYVSKSDDVEAQEKFKCITSKIEDLLDKNATCIDLGLNTTKILNGDREILKKLLLKIEKEYPKRAEILKIVSSDDFISSFFRATPEAFLDIFNGSGTTYREKNLDIIVPTEVWKRVDSSSWNFYQAIKLIVTNPNLKNLSKSLLDSNLENATHKALFFLAINELRHGNKENSLKYLDKILAKESRGIFKDRALFWSYLITDKREILERICDESKNPNLYSILAHERLGREPNYSLSYDLDTRGDESGLDTRDPFFWVEYREKILSEQNTTKQIELIERLRYKDTIGHLSNILAKVEGYNRSYFVRPYEEILEDRSSDKKALIYAIARQESLFIPTAVSTSYALGMMQVMPFNVDVIAKRFGEEIDYFNMFEPKKNIEYAEHIMDNLIKNFKNPLFVAYAYNGGFGFAKRSIEKEHLFVKGEYQPYMSLELLDYDESRYYGKKVLANYAMYKSFYGEDINVTEILEDTIK